MKKKNISKKRISLLRSILKYSTWRSTLVFLKKLQDYVYLRKICLLIFETFQETFEN